MKNFCKKNYYVYISLLGILLSVSWIIIVNTQPYSDFQYYNELAKEIANGGMWGNTYTSVGYSIVLGFIYKIFGSYLIVAKIFNIFLTALNYLIVYKLLGKINMGENRRKFIYGVFVIFPSNIFYNSITGTEILFTTIFLFITLVYFADFRYKYILLGILTSIAAMIKPFFILFFFAVFIIELILKYKFWDVIKHSFFILLLSAICISPWIYRNSKLMGQFTFISNNSGIVLYINNNSQNHYGVWMDPRNIKDSIVNKKIYIDANETEKNKLLSHAAKRWIIKHPKQFIILGFKRIFNTYFSCSDITYSLYGSKLSPNIQMIIAILANDIKIIVFTLAMVSIIIYTIKTIINIISRKKLFKYRIYNLILFYMFTCVYFITEGQPRYSFPITLIAIYFLSYAIENIYSLIKNYKNIT